MALLRVTSCGKLESIFIRPEHLGFIKIDTALLLVALALDRIILEIHPVWKIYRKARLPQAIVFVKRPEPHLTEGALLDLELVRHRLQKSPHFLRREPPRIAAPRIQPCPRPRAPVTFAR